MHMKEQNTWTPSMRKGTLNLNVPDKTNLFTNVMAMDAEQ